MRILVVGLATPKALLNNASIVMFNGAPFKRFLILLILVANTLQVDITIHFAARDFDFTSAEFTCTNVRPGHCCSLPWLHALRLHSVSDLIFTIRFDHLLALDIAAVWGVYLPDEHTRDNDACRGTIGATRTGPGSWKWDVLHQDGARHLAAKGASYISLPSNVPPNTRASKWLTAEGVVGLMWGGDARWFANPRAESILGVDRGASSGGVAAKSRLKRDIHSPLKGTVWATPPPRSVDPDLVVVNGTEYRDYGEGDLMYRDTAGNILNLSNVWRWMDSSP